MKKFYKEVKAIEAESGWSVALDGRAIITPLKNKLIVDSVELAEDIASEWQSQGEKILPDTMPLTSLANTVIDKAVNSDLRSAMSDEIVKYAASDLVCYFAERPDELIELQKEKWDPLIKWVKDNFSLNFQTVSGIQFVDQDKETIDAVRDILNDMSAKEFVAVQNLTSITGSFIISLALLKGKLSAIETYEAAFVDDIYQIKKWGSDAEAESNLARVKRDIEITKKFLDIA